MSVLAIYRNGVLEPQQPVSWRDGQRFRVEEDVTSLVPSYLEVDRPMTEAEILALEADLREARTKYRMSDSQYSTWEADRIARKKEDTERVRREWENGNA